MLDRLLRIARSARASRARWLSWVAALAAAGTVLVTSVALIDSTTPWLLRQISIGDARVSAAAWLRTAERELDLPGRVVADGWRGRALLWLARPREREDTARAALDVHGFAIVQPEPDGLDVVVEGGTLRRDLRSDRLARWVRAGLDGTRVATLLRTEPASTQTVARSNVAVLLPLVAEDRPVAGLYLEVVQPLIAPRVAQGVRRAMLVLVTITMTLALGGLAIVAFAAAATAKTRRHVRFLSEHDRGTGLLNGVAFDARLREAAEASDKGPGTSHGLILVDLRRFATVADRLGTPRTQALVRDFARRFEHVLAHSPTTAQCACTVGRLNVDTFAVLFRCVSREQLQETCEAVLGVVAEPFETGGESVRIELAAGGAIHPWDAAEADEWMVMARAGLRRAKRAPQSSFAAFDAEMATAVRRERQIADAMEGAVKAGGFRMVYQKQVDVRTRGGDGNSEPAIIGYEALMRWEDPELGFVSPAEFIPLAERGGHILALGRFSLEEACRAARHWPHDARVAVNLSPAQIAARSTGSGIVETVARALETSGLTAERLELEITEGLLLDDSVQVRETMDALRALGVSLSLDDFGTGYSSLSYLTRMPVSKVKLDRAFVGGLEEDARNRSVVAGLVSICESLGMNVIAEGVETAAQRDLLAELGCHIHQGYYYGRPGPV